MNAFVTVSGKPLELAVSFIRSEMVVPYGLSDSTGSSSSTGRLAKAHERTLSEHPDCRTTANGDHYRSSAPTVSSSATKIVGAPPEEIETACAMVCLPPSEAAHASRAFIEGKCTSAIR